LEKLKELLATFFYLGYSPFASGTAGSLGAMGVAFLFLLLPQGLSYGLVSLAFVAITFWIGVPLGHWAEIRYEKKDPGPFVLDEVMGYFVPLCYFMKERPAGDELVVAFFLFRLFDVIKPPPARQLERLRGGWGIMVDDLIAGLFTLMGTVVYHAIRVNPIL
jgi:phosphatidylglycerophosphatase A